MFSSPIRRRGHVEGEGDQSYIPWTSDFGQQVTLKELNNFIFYTEEMILLALKIYQDTYLYFYKRDEIQLAFMTIHNASLIVRSMEKIKNPNLIKNAGQILMQLGNLYNVFEMYPKAIECYELAFDLLQKGLEWYLAKNKIQKPVKLSPAEQKKREKIVQIMVLLLCNWANLCEQTVDYPKMNECFHMARYLIDNLLLCAASDEIRRYAIRSQIDHH